MATDSTKPISTATTASAPASSAAKSLAEPSPKVTVSMDNSDPPTAVTAEVSVNESDVSEIAAWSTMGSVEEDNSGSVNDVQKKIRRAERFGVPVQLSEQEKRNSRAERFGTTPISNGSEASKQSEELKKKARADRFGLAVLSTPSDEEEKKKARLARFAPYSKPDSVEEEKRKARAIRFSNSQSSSPPKVNGKGNTEPDVPVAGKVGGGL